jgi:hypothetical protein
VAERLTVARRRALRDEAREWDQLGDDEFARLFEKVRPVQSRTATSSSTGQPALTLLTSLLWPLALSS